MPWIVSPRISPWSATAWMVASGMVFTVSLATSSTTYMVSGNEGSLTLVDAHSGRCTRAPLAASARHRSVSIRCSYSS